MSTPAGDAPLVSVVVPVYNGEKYLREAMDSIVGQTYRNIEVIVVDDGSTDGSLAILKEYQAGDGRFRIISRKNTGIVGALNDAVAAARGKYLARMDSDDVAVNDRIARQVAFMEDHAGCVVCGGCALITDPDGLPIAEEWRSTSDEEIRSEMRAGGFHLCHPATLLRRDAVEIAGRYRKDFEWVEDLDLWLRVGELGQFANLGAPPVLRYRLRLGSVTHGKEMLQRERAAKAWREFHARHATPEENTNHQQFVASNPAGTMSNWALKALRGGHWVSSIRIACKAWRAHPRAIQPYVAIFLTLLGPIGKRVIPAIVRIRERQQGRRK